MIVKRQYGPAEATHQQFTLEDKEVENCRPSAKMNPPLRSRKDVDAMTAGLVDGTIDAIETYHPLHTPAEEALGIKETPLVAVKIRVKLAGGGNDPFFWPEATGLAGDDHWWWEFVFSAERT